MQRTTFAGPLLLILLTLVATNPLFSQSEAESASGIIELQPQGKGDRQFINAGEKVRVKYFGNSRTSTKLTVDEVLDSSIVLSGDTVGIRCVDRIAQRNDRQHRTGMTLLGIGLLALALSLVLYTFLLSAFFSTSILLVVLGILAVLAANLGFPLAIIGAVMIPTSTTTYLLWRHWKPRLHPGKPVD